MKYVLAVALIACVLGCGKQQPQIDYKSRVDTVSRIDDRTKDTTKVLVAALPGKFDSTDILLFPIGFVDLNERGYSKIRSYESESSSSNIMSGYFTGDELSGSFTNILFEGKDGAQHKLTDKKMTINRMEFLRSTYRSTKSAYLLYNVYDRDTNGDGQLDYSDLNALYISKLDGSEFKKITRELHLFYDHTLISDLNRIYLRTREDVNRDGEVDKRDKLHYYMIDFHSNGYAVIEFDPLQLFK